MATYLAISVRIRVGREIILRGPFSERWEDMCLSGIAAQRATAGIIVCLAGLGGSTPLKAEDWLYPTYLTDIRQGAGLSGIADGLALGGYELSGGTWVPFQKWYRTDWKEVSLEWLTQLDDDFGILWGLGTGERGEKYIIDPSIKLGFISQAHPSPATTLSLRLTTIMGGRFTELPCEADYGEIGGIQTVNCRLAASVLSPEDTLQYLVNTEPGKLQISLSFTGEF